MTLKKIFIAQVFQIAFFVLGLALLLAMLARMDFDEISARLIQVGWCFPLALAVHLSGIVLMARGWYETMRFSGARMSFVEVLGAYWTGHVINSLTPVRSLGDVLAGSILRERGRLDGGEMVVSLVVLNFAAAVATLVFVLLGPLVCLVVGFHVEVTLSLLTGVAGIVLVVAWFYLLLRLGPARKVIRLLAKLPLIRIKNVQELLEKALWVDSQIRACVGQQRGLFLRSLGCWLGVRLLQTVEAWIVLAALLPGEGAADLWMLAVLTQTTSLLVGSLLTFVPGQIGVTEGGGAFLFELLGRPAVVGFATELIRRVCKLLGIAIGLMIGSGQLIRTAVFKTPNPRGKSHDMCGHDGLSASSVHVGRKG